MKRAPEGGKASVRALPISAGGLALRTAPWAAATATAAAALSLTKPGITGFITLTAAVGFVLAAGPSGSAGLLATLAATAAAAAGAAALNQVRESDADGRMRRTAGRALPSGALTRPAAAAMAVGLSVTGLMVSAVLLPLATTALLAASHASYVLAYTPLKRRTPFCTLVGAVPGALPILAGWSAAGGAAGPLPLALAGIVYLWQIPHFLAIGWLHREDYERAGFRILPVVDATGSATGRVAVAYAAALVPVSLVPWLTGAASGLFAAGAGTLGGLYALAAVAFARAPRAPAARRLFLLSLLYLPALLALLLAARPVA